MKEKGVPQLEDGFARVANEILEAIARLPLSDHESRCIHFLWRKTYGWHDQATDQSKKDDVISYGQWERGTGIERSNVPRVLTRLVMRNIIYKKVYQSGHKKVQLWGFQKRYTGWLTPLFEPAMEDQGVVSGDNTLRSGVVSGDNTLRSGVVSGDNRVLSAETTEVLSAETTTKDNKDNYTKDLLPPTDLEVKILSIFKTLKGWAFKEEEDLAWLREFMADFAGATPKDMKSFRDWYSEKAPPKNKGPWKTRLRNWMERQEKKETDKKTSSRRPGKVPTEKELEAQAIEKGVK